MQIYGVRVDDAKLGEQIRAEYFQMPEFEFFDSDSRGRIDGFSQGSFGCIIGIRIGKGTKRLQGLKWSALDQRLVSVWSIQ